MTRLRLESQIREVDAGSETWRAMARAVPLWTVRVEGSSAALWNSWEPKPMGTLDGTWAPAIARYLGAMNPPAGLALAELLWLIGGHGTMPNVQAQAHSLLKSMHIDGVT